MQAQSGLETPNSSLFRGLTPGGVNSRTVTQTWKKRWMVSVLIGDDVHTHLHSQLKVCQMATTFSELTTVTKILALCSGLQIYNYLALNGVWGWLGALLSF